jgi:hypothetical protein
LKFAVPGGEQLFTRDFDEIRRFCSRHMHENVFFGATTRKERGGTKAHAFQVVTLWADVDFKDFVDGQYGADLALKSFPLMPSIIVCTGHGYHCYWLLEKSHRATSDIEGYLKGLAR